jgi:hypothetical protein
MPDSCTHIVWECPKHEAIRINRHNAACQLIHAAIRKIVKGGEALYNAPDLVMVMADTSTQPTTTGDSIEALSPPLDHKSLPTRLVHAPAHNGGYPPKAPHRRIQGPQVQTLGHLRI